MVEDKLYEFLGTGWSFPPTFSKEQKGIELLEQEDNVAKSIKIIIMTRLGERLFHPNLGTDINDFLFTKNINSTNKRRLKQMIEFAIAENEFRVDVDQVDVHNNPQKDCLEISVAYTVRASNTKYNMVFPFFYEEGAVL